MKQGLTNHKPQPVERVAHDVYIAVRNGKMFLGTAVKKVQRSFEANGVRMSRSAAEVWFRTEYLQDPLTGDRVLNI